jgi:hypothetical protein
MTKAEYDRRRYKRIKARRLAQMHAYKAKHRKRLNCLEAKRRRRIGKSEIRRLARERYHRNRVFHLERQRRYLYPGAAYPTRPQPKKCEACKRPPSKRTLHIDHTKNPKKFRGWLCTRCNTGIGLLGDNIVGLKRALRYLEKHDRRI